MKNFNTQSALFGALLVSTVFVLMSASQDKVESVDPMQTVLEALVKSQERQAAAWEKLAEKGWPTPQNTTITGSVPSYLNVRLDGDVGIWNGSEGQIFTEPFEVKTR
jgi:hypothetical protein